MDVIFREEQRFTQWWLWLLLIGITLIPAFGIYQQIFLDVSFGNRPLPDLGLILFFVFIIGFVIFFRLMRLTTEISRDFVKLKYFPFVEKNFSWEDVRSAQVVHYGFVGGWGVRTGTKFGTVYNVKGNKGLTIVLKNGKKFCLGTQKEDDLKEALRVVRKMQPHLRQEK